MQEQAPFTDVTPTEASDLIKAGDVEIIDVRQQYEYEGGHIPQSKLIPISGLYSFVRALEAENLPKAGKYLFVCERGQRSATAAELAAIVGFKNVYSLTGGMQQWRISHLPVTI